MGRSQAFLRGPRTGAGSRHWLCGPGGGIAVIVAPRHPDGAQVGDVILTKSYGILGSIFFMYIYIYFYI